MNTFLIILANLYLIGPSHIHYEKPDYFIEFRENTATPTDIGKIELHAMLRDAKCNELENWTYVIVSVLSSSEIANRYLGLARYRLIISYLHYNYKIYPRFFVFQENDDLVNKLAPGIYIYILKKQ